MPLDYISPAYGPKITPPGIRKNARQALTSVSQYVLSDFVSDFPDDEACLQWLWRQRYSQGGTHSFRERCEAETAFKLYETKQQRQNWTCTASGLHVHPTVGSIFTSPQAVSTCGSTPCI